MKKYLPFLLAFLLSLVFPHQVSAYKIKLTYKITLPSGSYKSLSKTKPQAKPTPRLATESTPRNTPLDFTSPRQTSDNPTPLSQTSLNSDQEFVLSLIKRYFGEEWKTAYAVARAESGLRCNAVGDTGLNPSSYGVFQIRAFSTRPPIKELLDCEKNIAYAASMQSTQGWSPWSAYTHGSYLAFINDY